MRSGQYKLCSGKTGSSDGIKDSLPAGQFRPSLNNLPFLSIVSDSTASAESIFVGSLHLKPFHNNAHPCRSKDLLKTHPKDILPKDGGRRKRKEQMYRHRSCENVSFYQPNGINRVEQKMRSLIMGDLKRSSVGSIGIESDFAEEVNPADIWQAGKIVTMHRRKNRLSSYSHSALHTLSMASDTASCLSASSGYSSSSSSSSYGSFKSCGSACSALPRHRNSSCGSSSPITGHIDNPLYDILPAITIPMNVASLSNMDSLPNNFPSSHTPETSPTKESQQDPIAKECREYLENRLKTSETFKKKWSLFGNQPQPSRRHKKVDLKLISKGDAIIDSKFNVGFDFNMGFGVESNYGLSDADGSSDASSDSESEKKNELDVKMEQLRQLIASLMEQDVSLFKQLLSLQETISALKLTGGTHPYAHHSRPLTPSDLDSFTEEEEDEGEEDEEQLERISRGREEQMKRKSEGCGDSVTGENITGKESWCKEKKKALTPPTEGEERGDKGGETRSTGGGHCMEEEEDEGHGTDLSLGHSPSHSPSPSSTLSSSSSTKISYSRSLYNELKSDLAGSFTRCRKSYAPNARNRRRASSVHHHSPPTHMDCSSASATALVVVHTDDVDALLNSGRRRTQSSAQLLPYNPHDALSYVQYKEASKSHKSLSSSVHGARLGGGTMPTPNKKEINKKENTKSPPSKILLHGSCSSQTVTSLPLGGSGRPSYREALIM